MKATLATAAPRRSAQDALRPSLGAELRPDGVFFRVWAPSRQKVDVRLEADGRAVPLHPEGGGYFSRLVPGVAAGARYRFAVDGEGPFPDPCSRFQPEGPHGPSEVVDPSFSWTDGAWPGLRLQGQVLYELHVGAFTPEGTFDAAARRLGRLAALGVTAVELMPVAEFPGKFNWGYDGVALYAVSRVYGGPAAMKRFVDAAHAIGIGVVLDVVYNHLGPDGNYLCKYAEAYFTDRYKNDWGAAINFDGPGREGPREFFAENAAYWIREFHVDGLRLDATQDLCDSGTPHIVAEIARRTRAAAGPKSVVLIGENEPQDVRLLAPVEAGGYGLDAIWADDFHHAARVALTGRREGYYEDYAGAPQEFVSLVKRGTLYQGQYYAWQKKRRGSPVTSEPGPAFVFYLENHDQIANTLRGLRLSAVAEPAALRALTALFLLAPETPLLFMGQERGGSPPFLYFANHRPELAKAVSEGRKSFLTQFESAASGPASRAVPDPGAESTFSQSVLRENGPDEEDPVWRLHRDLLALRRSDPVVRAQDRRGVDGAVLDARAFAVRFDNAAGSRLLVVNLGVDGDLRSIGEPILAPPARSEWALRWSSEDLRYGGQGIVEACRANGWKLPARSALFYETAPRGEGRTP